MKKIVLIGALLLPLSSVAYADGVGKSVGGGLVGWVVGKVADAVLDYEKNVGKNTKITGCKWKVVSTPGSPNMAECN